MIRREKETDGSENRSNIIIVAAGGGLLLCVMLWAMTEDRYEYASLDNPTNPYLKKNEYAC